MLSANSPNAKYLAGACGLLSVIFIPGIFAEEVIALGALLAVLGGFGGMWYFIGRARTDQIIEHDWRLTLTGFTLVGTGIMVWSYSQFVFDIDIFGTSLPSRLALLAMAGCVLAGLALVSWQTGRLAESVSITRARVGTRRSPPSR